MRHMLQHCEDFLVVVQRRLGTFLKQRTVKDHNIRAEFLASRSQNLDQEVQTRRSTAQRKSEAVAQQERLMTFNRNTGVRLSGPTWDLWLLSAFKKKFGCDPTDMDPLAPVVRLKYQGRIVEGVPILKP